MLEFPSTDTSHTTHFSDDNDDDDDNKYKSIPLHVWTGTEVCRRLRLPDFKTIGTRRWQGCQPYAPAAFSPP